MNDLQELLKDLKDIHEPAQISAWPPAIGWWLLPVVVLLLIVILRWLIKRKRTPNFKKLAFEQFKNIQANYQVHHDAKKSTGEIALLIRQVVVAKQGNEPIAGLIGEEWLLHLDQLSRSKLFSEGAGQALISAHYQVQANVDMDNLFVATKKLLGNV